MRRRVRRVAHPSADCDALELAGQNVEHGPARDERGRAERDGQLVARAIIVAARLLGALRDEYHVERRHLRRVELIERCVDMPAIKARDAGRLVGRRDGRLVFGFIIAMSI